MRILLHLCCGPCAIMPIRALLAEGHEVKGFFYNPNIHPYQEFQRRITAVESLHRQSLGCIIDIDREYGLKAYLRQVVFDEDNRCRHCYDMRLQRSAEQAAQQGMEAFSTTLLYSIYQQHDRIRQRGDYWAKKFGLGFYYRDFRKDWQAGIEEAKRLELYRQPYCGCIYSEEERYNKAYRNKNRASQKLNNT